MKLGKEFGELKGDLEKEKMEATSSSFDIDQFYAKLKILAEERKERYSKIDFMVRVREGNC